MSHLARRRPTFVLPAGPVRWCVLVAAALLGPLPAWADGSHSEPRGPHGQASLAVLRLRPARAPRPASPSIAFEEMLRSTDKAPEPTPKLLALSGKTVTLVGYMAELELPARGGFYLAYFPAMCDESAGGRGDLPQSSVFVELAAAKGKAVAFLPGPLEVSGTLEVGYREDANGEVNTLRLKVARPSDIRLAASTRKGHVRLRQAARSKPAKPEGTP